MARKRSFFGSIGAFFRLLVVALAAVMIFALYLNYTKEDEITAAIDPEAESEAPADVAVSDEAADEPLSEPAADGMEDGSDVATDATDLPEEGATQEDTASDAETDEETESAAVVGTGDEPAEMSDADGSVPLDDGTEFVDREQMMTFTVPGDSAKYTLVNVFQRDDGAIEVTTERQFEGATVTTTRLATCAPLAVGLISEGDGARIDAPDMQRVVLGTADASIAATACGALNKR